MLVRIAVVSSPGIELERIRSALRNPMRFTVREFLSMESVVRDLTSFPMDILLMRFSFFGDSQLEMIRRAKRRFLEVAIVALASEVNPQARIRAAAIDGFKLLEAPRELADLPAIVDKLKQGDSSAHRLHPRAARADAIQVIDKRGLIHPGCFLDFAQMGARLIITGLRKFEPREPVQLIYSSTSDVGKQHRIESIIVWSHFESGFIDRFRGVRDQAAGIRFIASY